MQNTTLYLIRHSIKYDIKDIVENYNTSDSEQIKNEKLILGCFSLSNNTNDHIFCHHS
jgi:hypothetical protein